MESTVNSERWPLLRYDQRLRAHLLCVPSSGASRPFVQHHEGDQPAAGPFTGDALRPAGPELVRPTTQQPHWVWVWAEPKQAQKVHEKAPPDL